MNTRTLCIISLLCACSSNETPTAHVSSAGGGSAGGATAGGSAGGSAGGAAGGSAGGAAGGSAGAAGGGSAGGTAGGAATAGGTATAGGSAGGGSLTNLVIDVSAFHITGNVTLNGSVPTSSGCTSSRGWLRFKDPTGTALDTFYVTIPCAGSTFTFDVWLRPATYVVSVEGNTSTNLPRGEVIVDPSFVVSANRSGVTFDVRTVSVSGTVTLDGAAIAKSCAPNLEPGRVVFENTATGVDFDVALPCGGTDAPYSLLLPPGTYDVTVLGAYSNLPRSAKVFSGVPISAARTGYTLNVETMLISGVVTMNGLPVGSSCTVLIDHERGWVRFKSQAGAIELEAPMPCSGSDATFSGRVPRGTYTLSVKGSHSLFPQEWTPPSNPTLSVTGPQSGLHLDVGAVSVAGTVRVNGQNPTNGLICATDRGVVVFSNGTQQYTFSIPCSGSTFNFSGWVPKGTWKVFVSRNGRDSSLPERLMLVERALPLTIDRTGMVLDVRVTKVLGTVTVNGVAQTACRGVGPNVRFTELVSNGDSTASDARCSDHTFSVELLPTSAYQVSIFGDGAGIPQTQAVLLPSFTAGTGTPSLTVDVPLKSVRVRVTQNGAQPVVPCLDNRRGGLELISSGHFFVDAVFPCAAGALEVDVPLMPETYSPTVRGNASWLSGSARPPGTLTVTSSGPASATFDLRTTHVAGELTLNGANPPQGACTDRRGTVYFQSVQQGWVMSTAVPIPCSATSTNTFEADLLRGVTYHVAVEWSGLTTQWPLTLQVP